MFKFVDSTPNGAAAYITFPRYVERDDKPILKSSSALDTDRGATCDPIFLCEDFHLKCKDINVLIELLEDFRDNGYLKNSKEIIDKWYPEDGKPKKFKPKKFNFTKKNKKNIHKIYTEKYDSIFSETYGKSFAEKKVIEENAVVEGVKAVIEHFEEGGFS